MKSPQATQQILFFGGWYLDWLWYMDISHTSPGLLDADSWGNEIRMEQGSWDMLGYGYACSVWFCVQMFQWDDDPSYLYATCIWRMGWSCLQPINLWEPWFPGSMLDFAVWNPGHCSSVCLQEILPCCNSGLTVYTTVYVYIHSIVYTYTYTYAYTYTYTYVYIYIYYVWFKYP